MKITGKLNYEKLNEVKRLYLPDLKIEDNCDHCKKDFSIELSQHYPYSFKADGSCQVSYLCPHCEEGIDRAIKMEINLIAK